MKIVRVPKREFEEKHPHSAGFHYTTEEGKHVIEVPIGTSTKSIMHEIAHVELGHKTVPEMSVDEWARRELDADKWVYDKLGRETSWDEILTDFIPIVEGGFDKGYSQNDLFNFVKKECGDAGYIVDDGEKSLIWDFVKRIYRVWKK